MCLTESGHAGLAPDGVETGDHVVRFDGSPDYFVLRPIVHGERHGPRDNEEYNLVGRGSFIGVASSTESQ